MKKKWKINDYLVVTYKDVDGVPIISKVYNISNTMFLVWNDYRECFEWVYMSKCKLIKMPK